METMILLATEKSVEALKQGFKVLVVGGMDKNFSAELLQNPKLVFWNSNEPDCSRPKPVPEIVGLALLTPFVSHATTKRVANAVRCVGPIGVGQISNVLEEALSELNDEQPEDSAAMETVARVDYSGLADFLVDQIPGNALGFGLLDSEPTLEQLRQKAEQYWSGISVQRVRRALRHALYELGLLEIETEDATETPQEATAGSAESPDAQIKRLTKKVGELQHRVNCLERERRGLEERRRKDQREAEQLAKKVDKTKDNLRFVLSLFGAITRDMKEQHGLSLAMHPNDGKRISRMIEELTL